jgi:hypothetical protein
MYLDLWLAENAVSVRNSPSIVLYSLPIPPYTETMTLGRWFLKQSEERKCREK